MCLFYIRYGASHKYFTVALLLITLLIKVPIPSAFYAITIHYYNFGHLKV